MPKDKAHKEKIERRKARIATLHDPYVSSSEDSDEETQAFINHLQSQFTSTRSLFIITGWLFAYWTAARYEFGLVFFVLSLLLFMYYNTRTIQGKDPLPSAYSVFNQNQERLVGDRDPGSIDQQLRQGGMFQ